MVMTIHGMAASTKGPSLKRRRRQNIQNVRNTIVIIICILPIVALSSLLYTYWNFQSASNPFKSDPSQSEGHSTLLDRSLLHPQEHVLRDPTTLFFDWTLTVEPRRPDGVKKDVYLVNGQFPGPTIEARSGDRLVIRVHNGIANESVSIHCHGLELMNQNAYDGAAGVTQCPIAPSTSFNYTINIGAEEHGTFWWHGHAQMHRGDGLYGGLVVHKPHAGGEGKLEYGVDEERLLLIGDWFHRSSPEVVDWYQSPEAFAKEPVPDSMVVNGHGSFNCSRAQPARPLDCEEEHDREPWSLFRESQPQGKTRLRVVNVGTMSGVNFALSDMRMQPLEVDGGAKVQKAPASDAVGVLYPGERIDVILSSHGGHPTGDGRLFVSLDDENFVSVNPSLQRNQSFPLYPSGSVEGPHNWSKNSSYANLANLRAADSLLLPSDGSEQPSTLNMVVYAKTQVLAHKDNKPLGFINNTSWEPQQKPLIFSARNKWAKTQFVPFVPLASSATNSSRQWVELTINNLDDGPHPFHLHGHSFYVVSRFAASPEAGWGSFNPFQDDEPPGGKDLERPLRKDTVAVPRRGHVVLRFLARNPGIWMLHCHMMVHQGTGMGMSLHVGEAEDNKAAAEVAASSLELSGLCHEPA